MEPRDPALVGQLERVLLHLLDRPCPYVPNPTNGPKKRASVALILRLHARNSHEDEEPFEIGKVAIDAGNVEQQTDLLKKFFSRQWIREGDPEVLFIKRAGRAGDR